MFDTVHGHLLPSDGLRRELAALLEADPELRSLTSKQPGEPEGPDVTLIRRLESGAGAYPMVSIPVPGRRPAG